MSDRHQVPQVEELLEVAASSLVYPPTPDIASAVRARLAREGQVAQGIERGPTSARRPRLAWVALTLLAALLLSLAVPEVQAFVRSVLRIGSIEIRVPTPTPGSTPGQPTAGLGTVTLPPTPGSGDPSMSIAGLMGETTLADMQERLGRSILLPSYPPDLGPPDRVYAQYWAGTIVMLVWLQPGSQDHARLILYQVSSEAFGEKASDETILVQETTVNGMPAAWVTGPHVLQFLDSKGRRDMEAKRFIDGNVLVWERNGVTYRLESALTLEEAVRVAESLR